MEMHQIRYFIAVCETLNFTRAAERCNVAQPSLTRAIQKLEEELGGPLFHRERSRTHLTPLGKMTKPFLEQTYLAAAAAKAEAESFSKMGRATLQFGVMCTIGPSRLVGLMSRLREQWPNLEVRLSEARGSEIVESVLAGELEVGLAGLPSYPDRIRVEPLYRERYVVAFPAGHRFETMPSVPLREMDGEKYLRRVNCEFPEHFAAMAGEWTCNLNIQYESEREDWIQAMVMAGMGCSLIPEDLPLFPGLRTRIVVEPEIHREIALATAPGRRFSPAVDIFVRLVRSHDWSSAA